VNSAIIKATPATGAGPVAQSEVRTDQSAMFGWLLLCVSSLTVYLCASHAVREFLREAVRLWDKI